MLILTNENKTFDLNLIGKKISKTYFSCFDVGTKDNWDYVFKPLVFLETFDSIALDLKIGQHKMKVPGSWSIVVASPETGAIEVVAFEDINNRDFSAFVFNPLRGFYPKFMSIKVEDVFSDVNWCLPKLENHNFLLCPLKGIDNPECILIINERDQKKLPTLAMSDLI